MTRSSEGAHTSKTGKRRLSRARRLAGSTLSLLAALFLMSAVARIGDSLTAEETATWQRFAAWAQTTQVAETPPTPASMEMVGETDALIAALMDRERSLSAREKALAEREHTLALAKRDLEASVAAFETAEQALRETLALADGAAQADLDRLTRMYETMKPKDAAALFETMDPTFAAGFLGQMAPAAASEILSGLTPETAYTISLVLAGRNLRVPVE